MFKGGDKKKKPSRGSKRVPAIAETFQNPIRAEILVDPTSLSPAFDVAPPAASTPIASAPSGALVVAAGSAATPSELAEGLRPPIDEVFSISTVPNGSFVDRQHPALTGLATDLHRDDVMIVIVGPAAIGKSLYVNREIASRPRRVISLKGRPIKTMELFWRGLIAASREAWIPGKMVEDKENALTISATAGAEGGLGHIAKAHGEVSGEYARHASKGTEWNRFGGDHPETIGMEILERLNPLVKLDDFHEIKNKEVRSEIVGISKDFTEDKKAKFVFISTSEKELDVFTEDVQFSRRHQVHYFPSWSDADLASIVSSGLDRLKCWMNVDDRRFLVRESLGNPAILSEMCQKAAHVAKARNEAAWRSSPASIRITSRDVRDAAARQVQKFRPSFSMLAHRAIQSSDVQRAGERSYVVGGMHLSIYHLILEALRKPGFAEPHGVSTRALRDRIRELLDRPNWASENFERHLAVLAATDLQIEHRQLFLDRLPERAMEFSDDLFFVKDPTLRTYLYRGGDFYA